ncbi:MAG: hypothetical protein FWE47_02450 [Oscillospiraceae bacterium]|nr:hypothetical protein [Oscillospiraceae bacterium]
MKTNINQLNESEYELGYKEVDGLRKIYIEAVSEEKISLKLMRHAKGITNMYNEPVAHFLKCGTRLVGLADGEGHIVCQPIYDDISEPDEKGNRIFTTIKTESKNAIEIQKSIRAEMQRHKQIGTNGEIGSEVPKI